MENEEQQLEKKVRLEDKILPILKYIGTIGAIISSVMYIIVVFVLIYGFEKQNILETTIFGIINAIMGFIIMQFLKVQGEDLAKSDPENQKILKEYNSRKTEDKKFRSMTYYWITSVVKDVLIKCTTVAITSIGVIYIVIKGNKNYNLILLAFANLLLFASFGLLSLNKAYNFFNDMHIPYIKEQIKASTVESEKEKIECLNLETKSSEIFKNK